MPPGERKAGLLVFGQRVVRGLESCSRVTLLATVAPRIGRELTPMLILVAIHAERKLDLVARSLAGRDMAVSALQLAVRRDQRIFGFCVIGNREGGRAPTFYGVAAFAAAAIGALQKLAAVRIGSMAIGAQRVPDRQLEVFALVAGDAGDLHVFAQQRKLRLRVVEARGEAGFLPRARGVAEVAVLLELALVGIAVAADAGGELQSSKALLTVVARQMALLAGRGQMRSGERVAGLGVVEVLLVDLRGLPVDGRMALRAVGSKAALMLVFVAG